MIHWLRFLIILVVWFTTFTAGSSQRYMRLPPSGSTACCTILNTLC